MNTIRYLDRLTGQIQVEKVYGEFFLKFLYNPPRTVKIFSCFILTLIARFSFFSKIYGMFQKSKWSQRKVIPFIAKYRIDATEFARPADEFRSFNDFFIRKLKKEARPIDSDPKRAILPADGRYLVFPKISRSDSFKIKGQHFSLSKLLRNETLASRYEGGVMVIARLCPVDYHRFHFPVEGIPCPSKKIRGPLFSVNPIALKKKISYLRQNKRQITEIESDYFGKVLFIEVGATYVGTIKQTYAPHKFYCKGDEKGYFEFGGSCLILLFMPGKLVLDHDLISASSQGIEVLGRMGQSLGIANLS